MATLAEYAKGRRQPNTRACWLGSLPQRQEVEEGFRSGLTVPTIIKWMNAEGIDGATTTRLYRHLEGKCACG